MWRRRKAGHTADRDRRDDSERAQRDPGGEQLIAAGDRALAAVRADQLDADHLPGEVRQLRPGAVCAGGERPGQRLGVDVAQVGHRQPARVQLARQRLQADAGLDAHAVAAHVEHPGERVEREQRAVRDRTRAERVARARDPQRSGCRGDELGQLVGVSVAARTASAWRVGSLTS